MSLFGRVAFTAALLFAVAALVMLLIWMPASSRSFVSRTDGLLRDTERDLEQIATALVDQAMAFSREAALASSEQSARAIGDMPLELFTDRAGRLRPEMLRSFMRNAVTGSAGGAEKHGSVRAEILAHTRRDAQLRLDRLREIQKRAATGHAEQAAWRTGAAWGGLLLVLLAVFAIVLDRVILGPLRAVTGAVGRFGAGERGVRLDPSGAAELTSLASAFNETAAAVELAEAENDELRAGLEEKVKERTDALVRAARASTVGTMAGGVAHEFNNLLGGILGCTAAALDEEPTPALREPLEMIRKTAERGVGVTRALLRATSTKPRPEPCDPAALFDEALAEVRPPDTVAVERRFEEITLHADPAMLRQVLANLVRNGVEAMHGNGRLTLAISGSASEVVLSVGDEGGGIDPSVREILFEPFVTTRLGGREGAGLGLFLAERLVVAHRGRIEFTSKQDEGTRFDVTLPRMAQDS
ncbi:MAG: sensor histidine kinase [Planctomycetota bacterium]